MRSFPNPTVSAIISTYNSERFIRGCIEDLERQTIADRIELIVIDSGSREREGEIVRELQRVYPNIRYIRTDERETVYAAWNRAISIAKGRYITNANTDDRHRHDALEIMSNILDGNPKVDLVYADVLITRTANETFERNTATDRYNWFPWDRNILLDKGCFIGPQPMWRRSLHDLYGLFDPGLTTSGDYEFWLRISQTSDFHYIDEPLGLYLQRPDSVEHSNENKKFSENREILTRYRKAAEDGRLIGFIPFRKLREAGVAVPSAERTSILKEVLSQIDTFLASLSSPALNESFSFRNETAPGETPFSAHAIEQFAASVEKQILNGKSWFTTRQSYRTASGADTELRSRALARALSDARRFFLHGDIDNAVQTLISQGIKAAPSAPSPYMELADILVSSRRYEDALQVVPEMPPDTEKGFVHEINALCYAALGDESAARRAAREALEYGGKRSRPLVVLGTLAAREGDQAFAEKYFRQAVKSDPSNCDAWLSLGMLLWSGGDVNDAFDALSQSIDSGTVNADAVAIFIDMARRLARLDDAGRIMMDTFGNNPENRLIASETIRIMSELGRHLDTLRCAESFLVTFGPDGSVLDAALSARKSLGRRIPPEQGEMPAVSLCMIVKNEEKHLAKCLASVASLVHEMVVVDTGSQDRTSDIATVFGAGVHNFPWNGSFSDARNFALSKAKGDWILVLDADEAISAKDHGLICKMLQSRGKRKTAWSVNTRNYIDKVNTHGWTANDGLYPGEEAADGWFPSWKVRLFPNLPGVRFSGEVHEMVEASLREAGYDIEEAPFVVHHYGTLESDERKLAEKRRFYFEIGKKKLEKNPFDAVALTELAVQSGEMGNFDEAIILWNRVLGLAPDCVEALFNKGYALIMLKRYSEALDVSRRAVELDPDHKEALFNYGTCELYAGKPSRAVERISPVLERNGRNPQLLALMTLLCLAEGETAKALHNFSGLKDSNYAIEDYMRDRLRTLGAVGRGELGNVILKNSISLGIVPPAV